MKQKVALKSSRSLPLRQTRRLLGGRGAARGSLLHKPATFTQQTRNKLGV